MSTVFVTMVYNDEVFLDIWVRYYSKFTDRANLHIITHGEQPYAHEIAAGCNVFAIERDPRNPRLDQDRFAFINSYCSELTKSYDRVIYNDVDEIVVLDPNHGDDLVGYIESISSDVKVITPLGLEIIHRTDIEGDYDYSRGLFNQRQFVRLNGWYTKPCITNTDIIWGPDGHGSSYGEIYLDDNLYLFHLKWFDDNLHRGRYMDRLKIRFDDVDGKEVIVGAGSWSWSEMDYLRICNKFLGYSIDRFGHEFSFLRERNRIVESFVENGRGMYKINWFVSGELNTLPRRFIGII